MAIVKCSFVSLLRGSSRASTEPNLAAVDVASAEPRETIVKHYTLETALAEANEA
jgi:hypothetical protein